MSFFNRSIKSIWIRISQGKEKLKLDCLGLLVFFILFFGLKSWNPLQCVDFGLLDYKNLIINSYLSSNVEWSSSKQDVEHLSKKKKNKTWNPTQQYGRALHRPTPMRPLKLETSTTTHPLTKNLYI